MAKDLRPPDFVARLDELPSLPAIVYELSRVINNPMSSTHDVEKIMATDPSLTLKVLSLVNSAYYAIPGGVTSLGRAIGYIGFDTVNQLVLSTSILTALEAKGPARCDVGMFWKHAVGTGIAAETIAKFVEHPMPSDLFTCGLVHDMGKIALYVIDPDAMVDVLNEAADHKLTYIEAERGLGVVPHTEMGFALAKRWKLPLGLQASIRWHHEPDPSARTGISPEDQRLVDIVLLANLTVQALRFGHSGSFRLVDVPHDVFLNLGLDPVTDLKPLVREIKARLETAGDFLNVLGAPKGVAA